jgi:hypothetical protein
MRMLVFRKRFGNNLTVRLRGDPPPAIEDVLADPECGATFKNTADDLLLYLIPDGEGAENGPLRQMAHIALHGTPRDQGSEAGMRTLCTTAALCLAGPISPFMTRLFNSAQLISELKAFTTSEDAAAENPVFVGNFQAIIVAGQRCNPEFIQEHFPTILLAALQRSHLLGYQDFISVLLCDWPDKFADNAQFARIGRFLQKISDDRNHLNRRRILGIFSALSNWLHEMGCPALPPDPEEAADVPPYEAVLPPGIFQPDLIRGIVEAAFCEEGPTLDHGILPLGINLLAKILTELECRSDLDPAITRNRQDYVREYGDKLWKRLDGANKNWESKEFDAGQKILLTAFPVFWEAQIGAVFPVFARRAPFSAAFAAAMEYRLRHMERGRLLCYVAENRVNNSLAKALGEFEESAAFPVHVARFLRHIASGKIGWTPPDAQMEDWERLSRIIVDYLLPREKSTGVGE